MLCRTSSSLSESESSLGLPLRYKLPPPFNLSEARLCAASGARWLAPFTVSSLLIFETLMISWSGIRNKAVVGSRVLLKNKLFCVKQALVWVCVCVL